LERCKKEKNLEYYKNSWTYDSKNSPAMNQATTATKNNYFDTFNNLTHLKSPLLASNYLAKGYKISQEDNKERKSINLKSNWVKLNGIESHQTEEPFLYDKVWKIWNPVQKTNVFFCRGSNFNKIGTLNQNMSFNSFIYESTTTKGSVVKDMVSLKNRLVVFCTDMSVLIFEFVGNDYNFIIKTELPNVFSHGDYIKSSLLYE